MYCKRHELCCCVLWPLAPAAAGLLDTADHGEHLMCSSTVDNASRELKRSPTTYCSHGANLRTMLQCSPRICGDGMNLSSLGYRVQLSQCLSGPRTAMAPQGAIMASRSCMGTVPAVRTKMLKLALPLHEPFRSCGVSCEIQSSLEHDCPPAANANPFKFHLR